MLVVSFASRPASSLLPATAINGLLVAHAESCTEHSTEAFCIRIFSANPKAFVKAFSNAPETLNAGFAKVDKILKALHVRNLYLYPRFHDAIRTELERTQIDVTELHQPLTPKQREIQNALAAFVGICVRQLKQSTGHLVLWNTVVDEMRLENCVTVYFDCTVSRLLEPFWHRLPPSAK